MIAVAETGVSEEEVSVVCVLAQEAKSAEMEVNWFGGAGTDFTAGQTVYELLLQVY